MDPLSTYTPGRSGWGDIINQNWIDLDERMSALKLIDAISVENDSFFAGNTGFGTLLPTERLHVVGNAIITGTTLQGGNVNVLKETPEHRLTDSGDSLYTRLTRTDTGALAQRRSYVMKPGGLGFLIDLDGDASTDKMLFGDVTAVQFGRDVPFSVGFILTPDDVNQRADVISKFKHTAPFNGWVIQVDFNLNGSLACEIIQTVPTKEIHARTGAVLTAGTTYHIVMTYSGSNNASGIKFYVDGSPVAMTVITNNAMDGSISTTNDFMIGGSLPAGLYLDGQIDEVVIWDKELSAAEVTTDYNGGAYTYHEPDANLIAIYHCDTGSGTTLFDSSGNGHDSTSWNGTPSWVAPGYIPEPGSDVERNAWTMEDGTEADEAGIVTSADDDTRSQHNGKTHRFKINGVDVATIDEDGVWHFGTGADQTQIDDNGNVIFLGGGGLVGTGISAYDVQVTETISGVGIANKVQVTAFDTDDPSNLMTPDHTNDHITVVKAGHYIAICSLTIESPGGGAASEIGASVWKNNGATEFQTPHAHRQLAGGGGDIGSMSLTGLIDLAVDDTIEVWLWNETNTSDVIVDDVTLTLIQVFGT